MQRTQIYLTQHEHKALVVLSRNTGKTQSQLIRDAIDTFIETYKKPNRKMILQKAAGLWKERKDLPDFKRLREEFDRHKG